MKVDAEGNLFAAGPGGVHVFAPDGTHLGSLELDVPTSNVAWGGDGSTLYVTASSAVYRIGLHHAGPRVLAPRSTERRGRVSAEAPAWIFFPVRAWVGSRRPGSIRPHVRLHVGGTGMKKDRTPERGSSWRGDRDRDGTGPPERSERAR